MHALRSLARRHPSPRRGARRPRAADADPGHTANPALLAIKGVGAVVGSQLLITAGDNPDRLRSSASFAALCGTASIPASSGRTDRHRLSRGGDRQANAALHHVVKNRMPATSAPAPTATPTWSRVEPRRPCSGRSNVPWPAKSSPPWPGAAPCLTTPTYAQPAALRTSP
ncbi:hypothetical protein BN10_720047 [Phycicoccus elongatus Lp2]|uniref:Transposase IS116/IS110/IS902 C-terminal domain-containing protein n=1 Tax=Phycicoccus elongatus Lp2 TaxID=1193181 RepID=N0E1X9_9MICO|nr:hypothetical protein BN10_720047 [Phycicoccus elongatus Lp2]